ncbi:MAG: MFS family permease [Candidatus Pelagisphaera sp.]|jgi:MFS family permease
MRLSIIEGVVAMPLVFMTMPGNFLVASMATDLLKLSEGSYGIIASLPAWCNIIQLFAMPVMTRKASQKNICLAFSWVHLLCWALLATILPYIPHDGSWPAVVFMISLFGASSFAFAIINISWTSWIQEWLPKRSRGKYLGRRNRILQCGMVLFLIAASQTIKAFTETNLTLGFQWIIATGILLRSISIVLQQRIYSREDASVDRTGSLASKFTIILKHKSLFRFILFGAAFGLTANFMGPFFPVFMLKALGMTTSEVGYAVMTATITGALSMTVWGKLVDRHGCRLCLIVALSSWMINGYLFTWTSPSTHWLVYLIFATGGMFGAGFLFGSFTMILKLVPQEAKTASISLNLAVTSLAGALSPIAGGFLIEWAQTQTDDFLSVFHTLSAIHHTLVLLTVLILFSIDEPKSSSIRQAVGSMRALRQAGTLLGLSYLMNYSFIKKRKDDDNR